MMRPDDFRNLFHRVHTAARNIQADLNQPTKPPSPARDLIERMVNRYGPDPKGFERVLSHMITSDPTTTMLFEMIRTSVEEIFQEAPGFAGRRKEEFDRLCERYPALAAIVVGQFVAGLDDRGALPDRLNAIVAAGTDDLVKKTLTDVLGDAGARGASPEEMLDESMKAILGEHNEKMNGTIERMDAVVKATCIHMILFILTFVAEYEELCQKAGTAQREMEKNLLETLDLMDQRGEQEEDGDADTNLS
jgi:hypothetical protein